MNFFYKNSYFALKGKSNEIFDLQFFHNLNLPVPLTNGLKYFWFVLRIRWVIQILSPKIDSPEYQTPASQSPQGIIPRQVSLPWVSYPGKSISLGYYTPANQSPRGIIHWRVNKKSAKKWLPGYDTPASQYPRGIIPWRVSFFDTKVRITWRNLNQNQKYLNPMVSGPGWFEWWKKWAVENLVGLFL